MSQVILDGDTLAMEIFCHVHSLINHIREMVENLQHMASTGFLLIHTHTVKTPPISSSPLMAPHTHQHITKTDFRTAETLIHTLITSRLDYYNSVLYCTSSTILKKLQYIQNSAARLLIHSWTTLLPVLQNLH